MQAHTVNTLLIGKPLKAKSIILLTEFNTLIDPTPSKGTDIPRTLIGTRRILGKINHRIRRRAIGNFDIGQHIALKKSWLNLILIFSHVTVMPGSTTIEFEWVLTTY